MNEFGTIRRLSERGSAPAYDILWVIFSSVGVHTVLVIEEAGEPLKGADMAQNRDYCPGDNVHGRYPLLRAFGHFPLFNAKKSRFLRLWFSSCSRCRQRSFERTTI